MEGKGAERRGAEQVIQGVRKGGEIIRKGKGEGGRGGTWR